jgi:hypothetical protein
MHEGAAHEVVAGVPRLHEAQRPRVTVRSPQVEVDADDADERVLRFSFDVYQAVRVRSIDVFVPPDGQFQAFHVVEVQRSPWIEELRADLAQVDHTADFLDRSRHWLMHCGDDVVEVVAWEMSWAVA